jgi:hypothetical protein
MDDIGNGTFDFFAISVSVDEAPGSTIRDRKVI